jgi:RNA polymerase sigma factor (sigma-70 family)
MAAALDNPVIHFARQLAASHLAAAVPDDQLLQRYARRRDEAAFAALVRRHGPLVLGACRRVLRDGHAADDAFQATFIVLARKAGSLRRPAALGPWLYGVAVRTALKARGQAARRHVAERRAAVPAAVESADGLIWRDLRPVLDEAIAALPERYRVPFVLHHLEGATVAEVARRLGCPAGTVAVRLARARERLRGRLSRRGLTLSAVMLPALLTEQPVSTALLASTARAATVAAGQELLTGVGAATITALAQGGGKAMLMMKVKVAAALLLAVGVGWGGVGLFGQPAAVGDQANTDGGGTRQIVGQGPASRVEVPGATAGGPGKRRNAVKPSPPLLAAPAQAKEDLPDLDEVLRALPKVKRGVPYVYEETRDEVKVITDCVDERAGPVRHYPFIGPARLIHRHFKCVVHFTETITSSYPFPFETKRRRVETVYLDRDRLQPVAAPAPAPAYIVESPDILQIDVAAEFSGAQQVRGQHLVRPDGTVGLGTYGTVHVAGLTLEETRAALERHLARFGANAQIGVEVVAFNSKVCYVITERVGGEETVVRLPLSENDTVLDAIAQIDGLPAEMGRSEVWVARPSTAGGLSAILPVDWAAMTQRGIATTNYQLQSGDRIHVRPQQPKATPR